jgi:hypothetical protein
MFITQNHRPARDLGQMTDDELYLYRQPVPALERKYSIVDSRRVFARHDDFKSWHSREHPYCLQEKFSNIYGQEKTD